MSPCVGLFGTCGNSKWRKTFIEAYDAAGIDYFNPQVDEWDPAFAEIEADHLAEDEIILFPVTGETYGTGSLSETGFSILNAIQLNRHRYFVIMIDRDLDASLDDPIARKESIRARALVAKHLERQELANLYVVRSLEDMLAVSVQLHGILLLQHRLEVYRARP